MKHIININLSKDTPTETVKALAEALKSEKRQKGKQSKLYLLNEDIEKLHVRYEELFKQVKNSQNLSENQIAKECDILSQKYDFEIIELSNFREVDHEIKLAEIEARRRKLKPWRRCALWRLLFQPLTNRAQDIIDDRAKVDADSVHTAAENAINADRKRLLPDGDKKLSKREIKRIMRGKLKAALKKADAMEQSEAFAETQESTAAPMGDANPAQAQANAQELPPTAARRPRPPRSCRRPATPGQ